MFVAEKVLLLLLISLTVYAFGLTQHVRESTHTHGHTLDLVITRSNETTVFDIRVTDLGISDHYAIVLKISLEKSAFPKKKIVHRQWEKFNITDFKNDFTSSNLAVNAESDMHTVVQQFNHGLMNLIDKRAPLRERVVIARPKAPWHNSEIDTAKRLRRILEHKWLKTKSQIDHDNFRQQCAVVNDLILKSKETFYNGKIEDCDSDQNLLFKVIEIFLHNNDEPQLPSHNSLDELVNKFADYFTEKIQSIREQITGTDAVNSVFDDENVFIGTKLSSLLPASEDEVRTLISRSSNKSCCPDPIPAQLIKLCMDELVPIITLITNMFLTSGVMPSNLKEAVLIPLLKKICLDPGLFKNFRPVSNLTFLSKLIERVVALRLHDHMKINNLYEEFQSSYRNLTALKLH